MPNISLNTFVGVGQPLVESDMHSALEILGMDPAFDMPKLWAVLLVESRGFGFLSTRKPKILFERHVFFRLTEGAFADSHPLLCSSNPGGYKGGEPEYVRLQEAIDLCRGRGIKEEKAVQSASWGLGQVMGFNAKASGFKSASQMAEQMAESEAMQLSAMASFMQHEGMDKFLREERWDQFAYRYNGPNYAERGYHLKLEHEFDKFSSGITRDLRARAVQGALIYLGYRPGDPDGIVGQNTKKAIAAFCSDEGMGVSGELDDQTFQAIMSKAGLEIF